MAEINDGSVSPTYSDFIREEFRSKIGFKLSHAGDVLLTTKGTVGRRAIMPKLADEFAYSPQLCFFRVLDDSVDSRWLYYWLGSAAFWRQAMSVSQQTDMAPYISLRDLRAIEVDLPSIHEQRFVATALGALDDKIESNRRLISIMEELGTSLLESRIGIDVYGFPKYDPRRRLGDVLSVFETGARPKGGVESISEGVVSLGAENIQSAGVSTASRLKLVPSEFAAKLRRGHLENEDVLVYKDGGRPGSFTPHVSAFGWGFPTSKATINEHVYRVRAVHGISQALLYWILRSPWMSQEMHKRGTGVAIPGLNSTNFRDLPMPIIDDRALVELNRLLPPMLSKMLQLGSENGRLADLRDAFLPELLSGNLQASRILDVEAMS